MESNKLFNKSTLTVAGCYVLWGLLTIFWKLLGEVNSLYVLASRIFWALVVSLAVVLATGKWAEARAALRDKRLCLRLLAAGLIITANWGCYIWCVMNGHILDSSLAYYINPILAILVGCVIFRERLGALKWVAVGLALAGVLYPIISEGQIPFLAIFIGLSFAVYSAIKKTVTLSSTVSMFIETLFVSPLALGLMVYMEIRGTGAVSSGALEGFSLLLLPMAGLVTYLPMVLFSFGIKKTDMSIAGILMYINPTLQLLLGVLLYQEELTSAKIVTFVFVWAALIVFLASDRIKLGQKPAEIIKEAENA